MATHHRRLASGWIMAALAASTLSCRLNLGGPSLPTPPAISDTAATEASTSWSDALQNAARTGQVTVVLTEEELTSAVADSLAANPDAIFHSPAVTLRDGVITVSGVVQQGPLEATFRLVVTPTIDGDGRLGFELTSADFGPLPASGAIRETVSGMLSEALAGPMGSLATGFRVTSVAVADGALAIVAEMR
jgi:hypothetical protein